MRELIDEALAVDLVEDAASVVVPAAAAQVTHLYEPSTTDIPVRAC